MSLLNLFDKVTTLDLRCNSIGDEEVKTLSLNTTLTSLSLSGNWIGDEGAKALSLNTTLTTLDLGGNRIRDEGAKTLSFSTSITLLYLDANDIGAEGAKALALNTTLTSLSLYDNKIGDEGAKALSLNTTLTSLDLWNSRIGDKSLLSSIQNRLTLNRKQLTQRRSQFIHSLIILGRDTNNRNSDSPWRKLPLDMRRYILQHAYPGWILGMPLKAKERCGTFILNNIGTISEMLQKKVSWTITYRNDFTQFALKAQR